ncbi:MAG: NAD(P)/FAD-dependent oxidoreductase [Deltaproteobacteria bacterium]|nr:MAG: NAD(P)/FAD-dependent oxidoreductase [Deltaproteobacteria bacterium]
MKELVIIGAGTGGTTLANRMVRRLDAGWRVTVVDPETDHLYQPGLLFLPFGARDEHGLVRPRERTLDAAVRWVRDAVVAVDPAARTVRLSSGDALAYDWLVVASGARVRPDLVDGLTGPGWRDTAFDFYTLDGAVALRAALDRFHGGRLAINVVEMPIKCPVAPLEFAFLADAYFTRKGIRDRVDLVYVTPLDGAFTRPIASRLLGDLLARKGVEVVSQFSTGTVDGEARKLVSWDERTVDYDLLVSIPTHSGAAWVEQSGIGDELAFVPTDPRTLAARDHERIFVLGDATDVPASKAGSVAHFEAEMLEDNLLRAVRGEPPEPTFDGHANCFVETGFGKAMLIDFNYDVEPLPGRFPRPHVGPFRLLKESRINHWGKLAFRWAYWNLLLPGRAIPVPAAMSMAGKVPPDEVEGTDLAA